MQYQVIYVEKVESCSSCLSQRGVILSAILLTKTEKLEQFSVLVNSIADKMTSR
jgi:hypothetical protein